MVLLPKMTIVKLNRLFVGQLLLEIETKPVCYSTYIIIVMTVLKSTSPRGPRGNELI